MTGIQTRRLASGDCKLARQLFATMSDIFAEPHKELSDSYIEGLLAYGGFWAMAALSAGDIIGGLTAHTLPMTSSETSEIFVYDVAVRPEFRRCGVGRRLVTDLRNLAAEAGIREVCVPADASDVPALEFYRALGGEESAVAFFTFSAGTR